MLRRESTVFTNCPLENMISNHIMITHQSKILALGHKKVFSWYHSTFIFWALMRGDSRLAARWPSVCPLPVFLFTIKLSQFCFLSFSFSVLLSLTHVPFCFVEIDRGELVLLIVNEGLSYLLGFVETFMQRDIVSISPDEILERERTAA